MVSRHQGVPRARITLGTGMDRKQVTDLNWQQDRDREVFAEILQSIRQRRCAAVVGAGLSRNSYYPSWVGLLHELANYVWELCEVRVHPSEDLYEWAERCKAELTEEQYTDFFVAQFGEDAGRLPTNPVYEDLDHIPFTSIVTTNYDTCLLHATRRNGTLREVHSFPQLDASYLRAPEPGHIFHIHGLIHPDSPQVSARSVVFTKSEYEEAYLRQRELPGFLYQLVKNHDLLFIGFSLQDKFLRDQIERTWQARLRDSQEMAEIGFHLPERNHYAILPALESSEAELHTSSDDRGLAEQVEDSWFGQYGIRAIRYEPINELHVGLARVVETIRQATSVRKLSPLPRILDLEVDEGFVR